MRYEIHDFEKKKYVLNMQRFQELGIAEVMFLYAKEFNPQFHPKRLLLQFA